MKPDLLQTRAQRVPPSPGTGDANSTALQGPTSSTSSGPRHLKPITGVQEASTQELPALVQCSKTKQHERGGEVEKQLMLTLEGAGG